MSVSTNDLKNGMTLELDGTLFQVVEFQHVKPGKGGAFVRTKLRNVKTGAVIEKTFNAGVKVGLAIVERKDDAVPVRRRRRLRLHGPATPTTRCTCPARSSGDARRYLAESAEAQVAMHEGVPIAVELPASVVLAITKTDPGAKGDTRTGAMKPATLETGAVVQVPLFVEEGERIKVDTRSGDVHRTREGLRWEPPGGPAHRDRRPVPGRHHRTRARGGASRSGATAGRDVPAFPVELVEGVAAHLPDDRPAARDARRGLDACDADGGAGPHDPAGRRSTSCSTATTSRRRSRSARRSRPRRSCRPTNRSGS